MDSKNIVVIGTLDTKGEQIGFLKDQIAQEGHRAIVIDLSMGGTPFFEADITPQEIARAGGKDIGIFWPMNAFWATKKTTMTGSVTVSEAAIR